LTTEETFSLVQKHNANCQFFLRFYVRNFSMNGFNFIVLHRNLLI